MRAETERSAVLAAIAIQSHKLCHGTLPATIEALIPEFLYPAPIDYMDGRPLKYLREADGHYLLYSVGEDGREDGGDSTMRSDQSNVRNLWSRKDFVWPKPALSEEIKASRKEKK